MIISELVRKTGGGPMQIKNFIPEEEHFEFPFFKHKKVKINEEMDIDESFIEEDILEEMEPWERAFELGTEMANDEFGE